MSVLYNAGSFLPSKFEVIIPYYEEIVFTLDHCSLP